MSVTDMRKFTWYAVVALLLHETVVTRCHSMDQSLWLDEAWVANSVLEPTIRDTIYYPSWLQTSPPLFLMVLRLIVGLFGISNKTFHLLPVVFGIMSVVLMIYVASQLLRPFFSLVAVALFVFCPAVVYYSHQGKQFSTDVFVSLVLITLALVYFHKPTRQNLYLWLGSLVVQAFLSYQALFFLPGMWLVLVADTMGESRPLATGTLKSKWIDILALSLCGIVLSLFINFIFIKPNRQPSLDNWFELGIHFNGLWQSVVFLTYKVLYLASLLFLKVVYWRESDPVVFIFKAVILCVLLLGVGGLSISRIGRDRRHRYLAVFLSMPIVSLYLLYVVGFYPVSVVRLMLFLVPPVIILVVYGLQVSSIWVSTILAKAFYIKDPARVMDLTAATSLVLICFSILLNTIVRGPSSYFVDEPVEDSEGAVRYLSEKVQPDDVLYVHASMREQFKLYSRLAPVFSFSEEIVLGNIGWPCCPRDVSVDRLGEGNDILPAEMARLEIPRKNNSLWLLFSDRPGYWSRSGRRGPDIFRSWLLGAGCLHAELVPFRGVRIDKYQCSAATVKAAQSSLANEVRQWDSSS
jgi:hypothetical protein